MKIGVIGAGTWGIALARMLTNSGHDVTVWSAIEKEIDEKLAKEGKRFVSAGDAFSKWWWNQQKVN